MTRFLRSSAVAAIVATAAMLAFPGLARADDPVARFQDWMRRSTEASGPPSTEAIQSMVTELLDGVDWSTFGVNELARVDQLVALLPGGHEGRNARLAELTAREDIEGARALLLLLEEPSRLPEAELSAALRAILEHPARDAVLASGESRGFIAKLGSLSAATATAVRDEILGLGVMLDLDLPPREASKLLLYLESLRALGEAIPPDAYETVRSRTVERLDESIRAMKADAETADDDFVAWLEGVRAYADGAHMRGTLMHRVAPATSFGWYSGDEAVTSLADLVGTVVVLDFWATWCVPCIAAFPQMRELEERYRDYDVVVLGVTSLQGIHYSGDGPPIDCTGDPEKEYGLMAEFMASRNVTWPVAFSTTDLFNPDFGVRGVPHMVILDARGVVRFRGLHPGRGTLADKAAMIDPLLAEAGLRTPAPPASEP
jgi:thiol-disulfide isomerase/thioredoxin